MTAALVQHPILGLGVHRYSACGNDLHPVEQNLLAEFRSGEHVVVDETAVTGFCTVQNVVVIADVCRIIISEDIKQIHRLDAVKHPVVKTVCTLLQHIIVYGRLLLHFIPYKVHGLLVEPDVGEEIIVRKTYSVNRSNVAIVGELRYLRAHVERYHQYRSEEQRKLSHGGKGFY